MPDLRFVVFAARRKSPPTSWSRAARAGGRSPHELFVPRCGSLNEADFVVGQTIKPAHKLVDFSLDNRNVAINGGTLVSSLGCRS
jgi:hypothetical protein